MSVTAVNRGAVFVPPPPVAAKEIKVPSEVRVYHMTKERVEVQMGNIEFVIDRMDELDRQLERYFTEQQEVDIKLDTALEKATKVRNWQAVMSSFTMGMVGVAASLSTGGLPMYMMLGSTVMSWAHQVASSMGAYDKLAESFGKDRDKADWALRYGPTALFMLTGAIAAMSGGGLKTAFDMAMTPDLRGIAPVGAIGNAAMNVARVHLDGKKVVLENREMGIRHEMQVRKRERADVQGQMDYEAIEKSCEGLMQMIKDKDRMSKLLSNQEVD